jgi:cell shape-determining protein MreC
MASKIATSKSSYGDRLRQARDKARDPAFRKKVMDNLKAKGVVKGSGMTAKKGNDPALMARIKEAAKKKAKVNLKRKGVLKSDMPGMAGGKQVMDGDMWNRIDEMTKVKAKANLKKRGMLK